MKPNRGNQISTLLVDLDGTLVEFRSRFFRERFILAFALESLLRKRNPIKTLWALASVRRRLGNPQLLRESNENLAAKIFSEALGLSLDEAQAEFSFLASAAFVRLGSLISPAPGAVAFINWARSEGFQLVLATNPTWPLASVRWRLNISGLSWNDFFHHTTAEKTKACKPSIEYFQEILRSQGLSSDECLMIGNDTAKDGPAVEAGIEFFLISQKNDEQKKLSGDFAILKDFLSKRRPIPFDEPSSKIS